MNKWLVLLVVTLSLLVRADAFAAPFEDTASKLSALGVNGKRLLRGMKSTDDATDEERAGATSLVQKLETALSKTKLGQKVHELKLAKVAKREALVKNLLEKKASFKTLYSNKVTPGEFLQASGVNMADLPKANAALLVPEYGRFKQYKRFVERLTPQKVIPDRHGDRFKLRDNLIWFA